MTTQRLPQSIQQMAELLGRFCYVELALFAITGQGVLRSGEPAVAVQLSAASNAHAYRAELFKRRLLVSDGLEHAAQSTRIPSADHEILFASLQQLSGEQLAATLAFAWYPAMLNAYQERLASCDQASEGPVRLVLSRAIFDLEATIAELSKVCQSSKFASAVAVTLGRIVEVGGPFGTPSL